MILGSVSSFEVSKSHFLVIFFIMAQQNNWDIIRPIIIMLDGPTSYHAWSQNMIVFLKGHKLWRYVIGSIPKPVPNLKSKAIAAEDSSKTVVTMDDYEERLEEWESIQSKILSWFINTFILSIHNLLPSLETADLEISGRSL